MRSFRVVLVAGACGVLLLGGRPALAGDYNVSTLTSGEGVSAQVVDTGAFDLRVALKDGDLPSVVGEPKLGQGYAFVEKSFTLEPGVYRAMVALTDVTGSASRTGGGGASASLSSTVLCDLCRGADSNTITIVSWLPTQTSVSDADFSTFLRFSVDAPTTAVVRGIVYAGASTGGQLFADPRNPDVSVHWGESTVALQGSVAAIEVTPDVAVEE